MPGPSFHPVAGSAEAVFACHQPGRTVYYAGGTAVSIAPAHSQAFEAQLRRQEPLSPAGRDLLAAASQARGRWEQWRAAPYEPECLTLYLNQACNLACRYCFSDPGAPGRGPALKAEEILAAARLVADHCARKGRPLVVAYHGGGEPSLSWRVLDEVGPGLAEIARQRGLALTRYMATNGVMSRARAEWLTGQVEQVGLSCDGPADIQNAQRPARRAGAEDPSAALQRTARILQAGGIRLTVRTTLTRTSAARQAEICAYLCAAFHPAEIHVEPVYRGGRAGANDLVDDPEAFLQSYLSASVIAAQAGCSWQLSGARLDEIHGAYCNIFRQVLQLVPGGTAEACFKATAGGSLTIGRYDPDGGRVMLDAGAVERHRRAYTRPETCQDCLLQFQCTHGCPNACRLADGARPHPVQCQILQGAAAQAILDSCWSAHAAHPAG